MATARPVDPEAQEVYLKGSFHNGKGTPEDLDIAEKYFDSALEKDPAYAPAYAGLAWVRSVRTAFGYATPEEAGPRGRGAPGH